MTMDYKAIANAIAQEDGTAEMWWTENHSCGRGIRYGCCGGGKDIDRLALADAIEAALRKVAAEATSEPNAD